MRTLFLLPGRCVFRFLTRSAAGCIFLSSAAAHDTVRLKGKPYEDIQSNRHEHR